MINLGKLILYMVTILVTMFFLMGADSIMDKGYGSFFIWTALDVVLILTCWLVSKDDK